MDTGYEYLGWHTDKPAGDRGSVRCLRCGETGLMWVPRNGYVVEPVHWKLCRIGPWWTGRRLSVHDCGGAHGRT